MNMTDGISSVETPKRLFVFNAELDGTIDLSIVGIYLFYLADQLSNYLCTERHVKTCSSLCGLRYLGFRHRMIVRVNVCDEMVYGLVLRFLTQGLKAPNDEQLRRCIAKLETAWNINYLIKDEKKFREEVERLVHTKFYNLSGDDTIYYDKPTGKGSDMEVDRLGFQPPSRPVIQLEPNITILRPTRTDLILLSTLTGYVGGVLAQIMSDKYNAYKLGQVMIPSKAGYKMKFGYLFKQEQDLIYGLRTDIERILHDLSNKGDVAELEQLVRSITYTSYRYSPGAEYINSGLVVSTKIFLKRYMTVDNLHSAISRLRLRDIEKFHFGGSRHGEPEPANIIIG